MAKRVLPGFGLSFGITIMSLSLIVLLPLGMLFLRVSGMGFSEFCEAAFSERALMAYRLSFGASFAAAGVNLVAGFLVAWVLVRYEFPGRRLLDSLVDLPFALPTAVAGVALTTLYASEGFLGRWLSFLGIEVAFTSLGITVALVFIGLPFVVRTVEPVIHSLEAEVEEAAASLGAGRWQTFRRIILPTVWPALLTGFAMAFARAVGEYGSVIFIAGNMPYETEIAPLLIVVQLEQYNYEAAAAIAVVMLLASLVFLLVINGLQGWSRRRLEAR